MGSTTGPEGWRKLRPTWDSNPKKSSRQRVIILTALSATHFTSTKLGVIVSSSRASNWLLLSSIRAVFLCVSTWPVCCILRDFIRVVMVQGLWTLRSSLL
jgi:hypothetical protein